ncbi:uncharacterized protein LOC129294391 isoform X2 [Prosopis cineraria]|uniref:uncharacterized protein LOC129294391 isoform X2 n=1 Tax=Prosopis cineraria TaxID=364024 RepID=UPI00240EE2CB|nr:uncharacterized protein LOC129294391 isoform X2 [Prosopis cineraria]
MIVKCVGNGSCWLQIIVCGLIFSRRDGEKIVQLSMLLMLQNHGKMFLRFKIAVIELDCKGLKIIREGRYYYLVHQGEIQRCLGSRRNSEEARSLICHSDGLEREFTGETGSCLGILDKILFFIGDLEVASADAKRSRVT